MRSKVASARKPELQGSASMSSPVPNRELHQRHLPQLHHPPTLVVHQIQAAYPRYPPATRFPQHRRSIKTATRYPLRKVWVDCWALYPILRSLWPAGRWRSRTCLWPKPTPPPPPAPQKLINALVQPRTPSPHQKVTPLRVLKPPHRDRNILKT
jgi:hypothetical protein